MAQIGLALAGGMSPTDVVDCVKYAEEQGYTSAWFAEGHGGDQFSILTACALATRRIQLGTSISSIFVRSAPTIAMAAACVDHYSRQRFILGAGLQSQGAGRAGTRRPVWAAGPAYAGNGRDYPHAAA